MQKQENYFNYVYQIVGEELRPNPSEIFQTPHVYLIIDKPLQIIWIWAGSKSRLFHRYIAANWAGKLKGKKEYTQYKYEVIKQDREPKSFRYIMDEINNRGNYNYPGESRGMPEGDSQVVASLDIESPLTPHQIVPDVISKGVSNIDKSKLKTLLGEIKEIHSHVKYSIQHVEKRIEEIERIIKKL
ncbi:MAG: hypothetical protein JW891_05990 [Candidatus Lokiarchaeota archaeon]|nr:hypothetical protein [Candidatus Lokiarchaeota archaeon]